MTQPSNPIVSVIITTYNRADLLPRAVNSVLAQTFTDFELIIVDDCSPDDTQEVIESFADPRIRSVRHDINSGITVSRNTGIQLARGEYVAFLDDDDEWLKSKLTRQTQVLDASEPSVGLVYTWFDYIHTSDGTRAAGSRSVIDGDIWENMLGWDLPSPPSTYLVRKDAILQVGGFNESISMAEDRDFLFRISKRWRVAVVKDVLMLMYIGHIGSTRWTNAYEDLAEYLESHICRFNQELNERPAALSRLLRNLALAEMALGHRRAAAQAYWKAFILDPTGSLKATWKNIGTIRKSLRKGIRRDRS